MQGMAAMSNKSLSSVKEQNSALQSKIKDLDTQYAQLQEQIMSQSSMLEAEIKRNEQLWAQYN